MHVVSDELIVDEIDAPQYVLALRDDLAPVRTLWIREIDSDQPVARRVEARLEEENGAVVTDEVVIGIEVV